MIQTRRRVLAPDFSLPTPFRMSTDGFQCPTSVVYTPQCFATLAEEAGLETSYVGTSISQTAFDAWKRCGQRAIADPRLAQENRAFMSEISADRRGTPLKHATSPGIDLILEVASA